MKRFLFLVALITLATGLWAGGVDEDMKLIRTTMDSQTAEWNKGNLDGFMAGYWKSEKMTFQSGNKRLYGFDALEKMYKTNYAGEKMGKLIFKDIEIKPLSEGFYLVLGRWQVTLKDKVKEGLFSLIFRKIDGTWKIIHDHSS